MTTQNDTEPQETGDVGVQPLVHSPAPWIAKRCRRNSVDYNSAVVAANGQTVAAIVRRADKDLIVAAPKMKDALRKFVAYHDADHESMSPEEIQELYDAAIDAAKDALPEVV